MTADGAGSAGACSAGLLSADFSFKGSSGFLAGLLPSSPTLVLSFSVGLTSWADEVLAGSSGVALTAPGVVGAVLSPPAISSGLAVGFCCSSTVRSRSRFIISY